MPDKVKAVQQKHGGEATGRRIEAALAAIAKGLVEAGVRRLVVAGGETAGAVVGALGVGALRIGGEIDPGVPWTEVIGPRPLALALKSGNFGAEDFFTKAFSALALVNGYGRDLEDQADRVGLRYAYEGGYDVRRGPPLWRRFAKKYGDKGSLANFFFGNHSLSSERAVNLEKEIALNYPEKRP